MSLPLRKCGEVQTLENNSNKPKTVCIEKLRGDLPATVRPERSSLFLSNYVCFMSVQNCIVTIQGLKYTALQFTFLFCVHVKHYHAHRETFMGCACSKTVC